jgi:uncharacterized cupin superfamily protein
LEFRLTTITPTATKIQSGPAAVQLTLSPIRAEWVLEGDPITHTKLLATSADGTSSTLLWDCSAGRFNWFYDIDETIYFLEGTVKIKDETGAVRELGAGDWLFFPAGSHAEWTVDHYVRKIAFCRQTLPKSVLRLRQVYRLLKRLAGRGSTSDAPSMFQSS